jgi:hypothetical protein
MRYDSLDRIQRYTVQASAVSDKNLMKVDVNINYDEERKAISGKIIRYMNVGDMNALSRLVSDQFCDSLVMHYCQVPDTVYGKAEAMMLLSLIHETYPDGVWKTTNTEVHGKVVTHLFVFTGTSVFDTPLAVSYHQVKEHQHSVKGQLSENSEEMATRQIARNVAEYNPRPISTGTLAAFMRSSIAGGVAGGAVPSLGLTNLTMYDKLHSPRSCEPDVTSAGLVTASAPSGTHESSKRTEGDVISIPRSKGNESFRLDGRTPSFSFAGDHRPDPKHRHSLPHAPPHRTRSAAGMTTTPSSEHLANTLLRKTCEIEKRKMEVTFNDYNLIVQIVVSAVIK